MYYANCSSLTLENIFILLGVRLAVKLYAKKCAAIIYTKDKEPTHTSPSVVCQSHVGWNGLLEVI